ncbi:MAG: aminomethyl-transferring glycine dehydrogenase subunit GcvPA [Chloroflexi bacterium]|nr:aminomethyl-transferring glycine dehydrogenase subunit GcvPA [Chloroflexi bacterium CFX1]MCQ3953812.1 aminomethyl-transferring glycine dehydrogenase subunit GcvPA [Chloroflexota bacterium]RIK46964.1 MAG: aminomethyl-transferring glycine dehydrogenase subunit GcvPA [Chloroflexota bacterium]
MTKKPIIYPYIPNSVPAVKEAMLKAVNAKSVEDFYADIPESIRFKGRLNLPEPFLSEAALVRHVEGLLSKNQSTREMLSFLGAGCSQHYVPAVCDEINSRGEFLTAYAGEPYEDHGRFQALFEYESMMGELLNMDVVNVPVYDGFQATATALRMAGRITGRNIALLPATVMPDKLSKIRDYLKPDMQVELVAFEESTGLMNLNALRKQINTQTAAVFIENPSYLGFLETQAEEIGKIAHAGGALFVVGVDPISLGVINPPVEYGGDIVCGDIQSLGIHMHYGGGQAGFIASKDEERIVMEYPSRLFGVATTRVEGEYGFGDVAYERTSFAVREEGKEWVGTAAALWGITAGVYLALMGPQGMEELGRGIMQRVRYAVRKLNQVSGVKTRFSVTPHFKEFVADFNGTGRTVEQINQALLEKGIFGGKDLSAEFPSLGQCALYCVTEVHTQADMDTLANAIAEATK